jgi:hypothetical protein
MWDETLADSSLLNKAPSKRGGGGGGGKKEQQRERTQVQAKVGHHRAKEKINVGFVLGKSCEILLWEEERQKECTPKGLGNLTLNLYGLIAFLPLKTQFKIPIHPPTHPPSIHLHSLFTFGILPSGGCIQISAGNSGTNTIPAI